MKTEIILKNLGNLLPSSTKYSEEANAFLTNGYASAANNIYFNSLRFTENLLIKEDIGQGYAYTFLNGIRIYSLDKRALIAEKSFHCYIYSKDKVLFEVKTMLLEMLLDAAKTHGYKIDKNEAEQTIDKVIQKAFTQNQIQVVQEQMKHFLLA